MFYGEADLQDDSLWYKDAIIYEVHVKSFFDSNGDGVGDFRGLIEKLDYLKSLGITAVWLLPFYPSPLKDDGYDVANYFEIHPNYGTLQDFKEFLREAHKRGIRVIVELVLNHTSDQHLWFQRARRAKPGSAWRDFYVWSDTPDKYKDAKIIFKDFEASNWTWDSVAKAYYWHRFYSHQPDLNYDNPRVHTAIFRVVDFWLEMGVDGLRLDAAPYLYEREGTTCENLPETFQFIEKLRAHIDSRFKNRILLAEANQWPEDVVAYFGEGNRCHMTFHFPLMTRFFMAVQLEDRLPIIDIIEQTPRIPESCQWALFLRNHDELTLEMVTDEERDYMFRVYASDPNARINLGIRRRLAPLLGNDRRKIELMNVLLFSFPGTPIIYYGDEIGMGDNYYLGDRNGVRTPMQWSSDRNAGFSKANPQKLYLPVIIDSEYHYEVVNVENQERNPHSLLWWIRRLITTRKRFKAFSRGSLEFLYPDNSKVLAFIRKYQNENILVVVNLSRFSQAVELNLSNYVGFVPEDVFSKNKFPVIREASYVITLGPYGFYWFLLQKEKTENVSLSQEWIIPKIRVEERWETILEDGMKDKLKEIISNYLKNCYWFGGETLTMQEINICNVIPVSGDSTSAYLLVLEVNYVEGNTEKYLLPLSFASKEKAKKIIEEFPQGIVASLLIGGEEGVLYDGVYDEEFCRILLLMIVQEKRIKGEWGELVAYVGKMFRKMLNNKDVSLLASRVMEGKLGNTPIVYGDVFFLKLYRKLGEGKNPE
ncbi:MAG: maltose alpha-D-glucosyltransferase, partial [Candidatus Jordarchaeaceae archaeon]